MDIWQMRYFIQTYEDKSLTKAAKNLYITQQGLSKTIKNIEDEFQIPLFERTVKGVIPTVYGDLILEKSKKILKEYDEMVDSLIDKAQLNNKSISIGITTILYTDYLKTIICNFQDVHPDISLEFYELGYYTCEKYLEDNLVDICFTLMPEDTQRFDYIPISEYHLRLLTSKDNLLSEKSFVTIADLKDEKFIMLPSDTKIRKLTIDYCKLSGFNPNIIITTSQLDFIIELIARNKGIAILPEFYSVKALKISNNIAVIPFDDALFKIDVGFIMNQNKRLNHIVNALINYFLKSMKSKRSS